MIYEKLLRIQDLYIVQKSNNIVCKFFLSFTVRDKTFLGYPSEPEEEIKMKYVNSIEIQESDEIRFLLKKKEE